MSGTLTRTTYRNGDEIGLEWCGCDGCNPTMINGVMCHEQGCEFAWKDTARECRWCGCEFYPVERWQACCEDCRGEA